MTTGSATTTGTLVLALYAETPLHPGMGQSTGIVDLPVQREQHTRFPLIPATGLKGSFRELAELKWAQTPAVVDALFGPASGVLHAGALVFTDARLLAFPVRSLREVFLWVTCPIALGRLARDLQLAGRTANRLSVSSPGSEQMLTAVPELQGDVVLEDLAFTATYNQNWASAADYLATFLPRSPAHDVHRSKLQRHLALVSDEDFTWFVEHATHVTARVALKPDKTNENLWYEEALPADTLFYTFLRTERPRTANGTVQDSAAVRQHFHDLLADRNSLIQVGGNETIGHGWCAVQVVGEREGEGNAG